jgi:hypothetical protein
LSSSSTVRATDTIAIPDYEGDVGYYSSIALDDNGNPVISYTAVNSPVRVLHCGNRACTMGNSITVPEAGPGANLEEYTSMALDGAGNPVVSYYNTDYMADTELRVLHCGNPNCNSGNSIATVDVVVSGGLAFGRGTSLALDVAGNPIVSYWDITTDKLKVAHCGNPNCTSGNSITSPDPASETGRHSSMVLDGAGNPVVSYGTGSSLKILRCGNPSCTAGNSIRFLESSGEASWTSLELDSAGRPVVTYARGSGLRLVRCGDAGCTTGNTITSLGAGGYASLALDASDRPVISYQADNDLNVLKCGNATCSSGNMVSTPDSDLVSHPNDETGKYSSIVLDGSNPVISYAYVDNGQLDLRVFCSGALCKTSLPGTSTPPPPLVPVGGDTELAAIDGAAAARGGAARPAVLLLGLAAGVATLAVWVRATVRRHHT